MLAYKDGPRVRLISRNGVDHTARFRELAAAIAKLRADVLVLDGEVAVFDKDLVSRFHLLGDTDRGLLCTPPIYIGFGVLQVGRRDLRARPLAERRVVLEDQLDGHHHTMVLPCRRLPDDGLKAWALVEERGYESMVAKDPRSTYRSGSTRAWAKVKVRHEGVFVVGGIRDVNAFDGVPVGERVSDALYYLGVVEWGFRAPDVLALLDHARRWSRPSSVLGPPARAFGDVGGAAARGGGQLRGARRGTAEGAELASPREARGYDVVRFRNFDVTWTRATSRRRCARRDVS